MKKMIALIILSCLFILSACNASAASQMIVYTNADDEAVQAMEEALEAENMESEVKIQSFGTSELGGKLMAEGTDIEADVVTMSSYFLESAQQENEMFASLTDDRTVLEDYGAYQIPILGNAGAIFVNTEALEAANVAMPQSILDLTDPQYEGLISFPNLFDSSTGWLLIQAIIATYGDEEGEKVIAALKENAGPHIESSGSGPIKKVKSGEVPIGFGLRNQAVQAQVDGLPIDVIDPEEGNYTLVESVSVIDKENNEEAEKVAKIIAEKARETLLKEYPVVLYEGESIDAAHEADFKQYKEKLTVELLEKHQDIFQDAK